MAMESYRTGTGQALWVHSKGTCDADPTRDMWCVIHARKPGHMQDWPTHWRTDWSGFMEVICPHGIGHPAPENSGRAHGCDGCCAPDTFRRNQTMENSKPLVHTGAPGDEQTYQVRQGGLMRCCLLTLGRRHSATDLEGDLLHGEEGEILPCNYCNSSMVFTQGAWEWNKAKTDYTLRG